MTSFMDSRVQTQIDAGMDVQLHTHWFQTFSYGENNMLPSHVSTVDGLNMQCVMSQGTHVHHYDELWRSVDARYIADVEIWWNL